MPKVREGRVAAEIAGCKWLAEEKYRGTLRGQLNVPSQVKCCIACKIQHAIAPHLIAELCRRGDKSHRLLPRLEQFIDRDAVQNDEFWQAIFEGKLGFALD